MTQGRIERIAELLRQGLSRDAIGERLGITRNAVCGLIYRRKMSALLPEPLRSQRLARIAPMIVADARRKAGKVRSERHRIRKMRARCERIVELLGDGMTAAQIAQAMGLTQHQVEKTIFAHGLRPPAFVAPTDAEIAALYAKHGDYSAHEMRFASRHVHGQIGAFERAA